jgi:cytidylate kinase
MHAEFLFGGKEVYWRQRNECGRKFMYFITFSRKMGAQGTEIARLVAKELQYDFYDTEAIENTAREMGILDDNGKVDDKAPPLLKRLFTHRPEILLHRLHAVIYELAGRGNAVFLGRGGNILLRSIPCALHIRIIASRQKRLRNLLERGFTREAALVAMEKSDHERESFIKFAFRRDWENAELYDVILNMDNLTVDVAAHTILCVARTEDVRSRSADVKSSLEIMGLAARVEAALTEVGFPPSYISSSVSWGGKVRLTGVVQVPWEKSAAEGAVEEVEGVESVENRIEIASSSPIPDG